jgi:putative ABC transport system permease protein
MGSRRRSLDLAGLSISRTARRLVRSRQVAFAVVGVALAVTLVVAVGGIALGLVEGSTVGGEGVDYRIVPAASSVTSVAVPVGGPKLGGVHRTTARLAEDPRIAYVTPVDLLVLPVSNPAAERREYVLLVGVIPAPDESVAGLSLSALRPGDPHYANGTYDGEWTGEVVVSEPVGRFLNATPGTTLLVEGRTDRAFTVVDRRAADPSSGTGSLPVVVVHLAELQTLSGGDRADQADQILIRADDPSVREDVERLYPRTEVVSGDGPGVDALAESGLPLAVAVTALVTSLTVGTLLVGTMMGMEVVDDRRSLATLAAVGFSPRSRVLLVLFEVFTVAVLGGVLGVGLGVASVYAINAAADWYLGVTVATVDARLVGAGLLVSLVVGLFAAGYPLWLSRRTAVAEVLER